MASDSMPFSLPKVKAYRAYFTECRAAAKGTPEYNDLDVTVKLCDQLLTVMAQHEQKPLKKASAQTA
jgi:hypothetical protein